MLQPLDVPRPVGPDDTEEAARFQIIRRQLLRKRMVEALTTEFDERVEQVLAQYRPAERIEAVVRRGVEAVDRAKLEALRAELKKLKPGYLAKHAGTYNYLDVAMFLYNKARHIVEVDLDRSPKPLRILDLATGGGHFPFLAQVYGHEVVGVDIDVLIYAQLCEMYGVERIVQPIRKMQPLDLRGKFDLITALRPQFNLNENPKLEGRRYWTVDEWVWFIEHLSTMLNYPGRLFFAMNRYPEGERDMVNDLLELFLFNGAQVNFFERSIILEVKGPLTLKRLPADAPG